MNHINATVIEIKSIDNLTMLTFQSHQQQMRMISLGLNIPLKIGTDVVLGVKATSVMLAKNLSGLISTSNKLNCTVKDINDGELLSNITLGLGNTTIQSIITKESSEKMNLQKGESVLALIKASELSIVKTIEQAQQ